MSRNTHPNSLYIHIPFCKKKCLYCDFNSDTYKQNTAQGYLKTLIDQIEGIDNKFSTIYIGGGTPTTLTEDLLEKFLLSLKKNLKNDTEFTIEANPESLTRKKIDLFLKSGVNRISIGVQSLNDEKLKKLGRIHDARTALEAVENAKDRGFKNISIDLIFGIWGEALNHWKKELSLAVKLPVQHLSCYALSYENKTPIYQMMRSKKICPLDDVLVAKMFSSTINYLPKKGFLHYEVSNFSKIGFECRHNLNYWQNNEYLGIGTGAVSYVKGERIKYTDNKMAKDKLSLKKRAKETAALKIRTKDGINFDWFRKKTGFDFLKLEKENIPSLIKDNFVKYNKAGIALTKKGFLFCDSVSSSFL